MAARSACSICRYREPRARRAPRVGVVPQIDNLDPDFTVRENLLVYGRYFGLSKARHRRAHSRAARIRGARQPRRRQYQGAVGRHEAAADAGARADQRSRPDFSRRTDHRPRSAGAPSDLGAVAPARGAGQDDFADHALHGRSRAPVPPARHHGPRPHHGERHAARSGRRAHRAAGGRSVRRRRRRRGRPNTAARCASGASKPAKPSSATRAMSSRCCTISSNGPSCVTCTARPISKMCSCG